MKNMFKASLSIFRIRAAESIQYRIAALAGASTSIFWALIEITVLTVFYTYADNRADSMNGLSLSKAISYMWIGHAIFFMQPMNIDGEILTKIINGDVGIELCRPLDLYSHWFAKTAGGRLNGIWRGLLVIIAGLLIPASYRLSPPGSIVGAVLFFLSVLSAFLLCTSYGMLAASIRLGITWGEGPTYIIMLIGGVLSGGYLPLQLWPDFMQTFLLMQPFAGYLDIPARLYVGSLTPSRAFFPLLLQLAWTAVFIAIGKIIMNKKLEGLIVQGG